MDFIVRYLIMSGVIAVLFHLTSGKWQKHYITILTGTFFLIGLIFLI
jgi:hypothetical protein